MKGKVICTRAGSRYFIDGVEVTQAEYDARFPSKLKFDGKAPMVATPYSAGLASKALAVHKSQVEEANARNKLHGIATRYGPDGTAYIPNRSDRNKLLALEGRHDNDAGFGDR